MHSRGPLAFLRSTHLAPSIGFLTLHFILLTCGALSFSSCFNLALLIHGYWIGYPSWCFYTIDVSSDSGSSGEPLLGFNGILALLCCWVPITMHLMVCAACMKECMVMVGVGGAKTIFHLPSYWLCSNKPVVHSFQVSLEGWLPQVRTLLWTNPWKTTKVRKLTFTHNPPHIILC